MFVAIHLYFSIKYCVASSSLSNCHTGHECVVIPFILDVRLVDVPAGVTQKQGQTGWISPPFFSGACLNFSREKDSAVPSVSRDQILRHARGQGNIIYPCSAYHEQDWQPYPVDPYSAIRDDHTYIHFPRRP